MLDILKELGLPFAYDHFAEGESPEPPFVVYLYPNTNHFAADGIVYYQITVVNVELYTNKKDPVIEQKLEELLTKAGIFFRKSEVWIDSEKLYEVIYAFEEEDFNYGREKQNQI